MKTSFPTSTSVLKPEELLERVQGDRELLAEIIGLFRGEALSLRQELRAAVEQSDAAAVARAIHTLKGALGNFGSGPAYRAAQEMELLAKEKDLASVPALLITLESEVERLQTALEAFAGTVLK